MELADFLLARIAEDEAAAALARDGDDWHGRGVCDVCDATYAARDKYGDPARVLAECEAKRRIVKALAARGPDAGLTSAEDRGATWALRESCKALATPYADHADYRQEWRA